MAFSKEKFIDGYVEEVRDHIVSINSHTISLKNNPENKSEDIAEILRHLHTIKGSSRMMDFLQMEQISHGLESVFKAILESRVELSTNIIRLSFRITESFENILTEITEKGYSEAITDIILETCDKAASGFFFDPEKISLTGEDEDNESDADEWEQNFTTQSSFDKISSVRIEIDRINSIIQEYDNLIIKQFRLKHQIEALEKRLADRNAERIYEIPRQLHEELLSAENNILRRSTRFSHSECFPLKWFLFRLRKKSKRKLWHCQRTSGQTYLQQAS